jgi:hypothetical protein
MPTTRPRHQVTETPEIKAALDQASRWWPDEPRGRLLVRLVEAGVAARLSADDEAAERRREAIRASAGAFDDAFPEGFLAELRKDWPE